MLRKDKIKFFYVLFFTVIFSCKVDKFNIEKGDEYYYISSNSIGYSNYKKILLNANDSLNYWKKMRLVSYVENKNETKTILDSLLCFNSDGSKFVSCTLGKVLLNDAIVDGLNYFYGVKVNENWYFFSGPSVVLPREYYQDDIHTPLSFEKLHEIALKEIYSGYLKKNKKGEWEINDDFFSDLTSVAWCTDCKTQEDWDNAYLRIVRENWAKRDTSIIKEVM